MSNEWKNFQQLNNEITELLLNVNPHKAKALLKKWFRVDSYNKLDNEQLYDCLERLKDARYKGEI